MIDRISVWQYKFPLISGLCCQFLVVAGDGNYGVTGRLYLLSVVSYLDRLSKEHRLNPSRRVVAVFMSRSDGERFIDNVCGI